MGHLKRRTEVGARKVLVIDDDATVLAITARLLDQAGFDVLTAPGGSEGLRIFKDQADEILAVLVDMTMPIMNGEQTCNEIRRVREDVPMVLSSGYSDVECFDRLNECGSVRFLGKPYRAADLIEVFEEIQRAGSGYD